MKGLVFLEGNRLAHFLRIEYRASRLVEQAREKERFLRDAVLVNVSLKHRDSARDAQATVRMHYDNWINAYQVEIWETLEPPPTKGAMDDTLTTALPTLSRRRGANARVI